MKFPTMTHALVSAALLSLAGLSGCGKEEAADEPAALAYISNQKGNVTVIDLATFEPVGEINVGAQGPRGIGITPDGKLLVTANVENVISSATIQKRQYAKAPTVR